MDKRKQTPLAGMGWVASRAFQCSELVRQTQTKNKNQMAPKDLHDLLMIDDYNTCLLDNGGEMLVDGNSTARLDDDDDRSS